MLITGGWHIAGQYDNAFAGLRRRYSRNSLFRLLNRQITRYRRFGRRILRVRVTGTLFRAF